MTRGLAQLARLPIRDQLAAIDATLAASSGGLPNSRPNTDPKAAPSRALLEEAEALLHVLLDLAAKARSARHRDRALGIIATHWRRAPSSLRKATAALAQSAWPSALSHTDDPALRAVAVFESTADPSLTSLVLVCLERDDTRLQRLAGRSLVMAAELASGCPGLASERVHDALAPVGEDAFESETRTVSGVRAVADAAWSDHGPRVPGVMLAAAIILARPDWPRASWPDLDRLRRLLAEPQHDASAGLRRVIRRSPLPMVRALAWRCLPIEGVRVASADRLALAESPEEHRAVLNAWWLGLRPARQRPLRLLAQSLQSTASHPPVLGGQPSDERAPDHHEAVVGVIHWTRWIHAPADERDRTLEPLLTHPSRRVRMHLAHAGPRGAQRDLAFDASPSIARLAFHRWSSIGVDARPDRATLRGLAASAAPAIRSAACRELDRADPFESTNAPARLELARRLGVDRARTLELIADAINSERAPVALAHVRALALQPELDDALVRASTSSDARVAATAARLLSRVASREAAARLRDCAASGVPRLRANAVEALAELDRRERRPVGEAYTIAIELKEDDAHRVRANAIRALIEGAVLETGTRPSYDHAGVEALTLMLSDDRPTHRTAAAWVAQRCARGLTPRRFGANIEIVRRSLDHLARSEPDEHVRRRSAAALRRTQAEHQSIGIA